MVNNNYRVANASKRGSCKVLEDVCIQQELGSQWFYDCKCSLWNISVGTPSGMAILKIVQESVSLCYFISLCFSSLCQI